MRRLVVMPLIAALALTACSGADDDGESDAPDSSSSADTGPSTPAGEELPQDTSAAADELRTAAQAYSDAFLTGDAPGALALLSSRCQDSLDTAQFSAAVAQAGQLYGNALPFESYEGEPTDDGTAAVTYTYAVSAINQTDEPWVFEEGWKNDDC